MICKNYYISNFSLVCFHCLYQALFVAGIFAWLRKLLFAILFGLQPVHQKNFVLYILAIVGRL